MDSQSTGSASSTRTHYQASRLYFGCNTPQMDDSELRVVLVERALRASERGESFDSMFTEALTIAGDALPSPVWDEIGDVDRHADVRALREWTPRQLIVDPPQDLSALWFGLYEIGPADRYPQGTEAVIEVSGGPGFPDDQEWLFKQTWYPGGHAPTPGLRSLLPLAASRGDQVFGVVSYAIVFTYAVGLVTTALEQTDPATILRARPRLGIATGFHDGDIAQLGVLTSAGLDRSDLRWL